MSNSLAIETRYWNEILGFEFFIGPEIRWYSWIVKGRLKDGMKWRVKDDECSLVSSRSPLTKNATQVAATLAITQNGYLLTCLNGVDSCYLLT